MVALSQDDGFVDVTRVETSDVALGGNEINVPNKQFVELASRDQWLKDELESRTGSDATAIASFERSRDLSQASIAQGRLTLATGDPTPSSDITAATTLYYTPYNGDLVSLWNSAETRWDVHQFTERSLSLSGLAADANYDIFLYDNAGTLTLEAMGWSNSGAGTSARASAISRRNGIWVKTSDDRRYLGTIRTTATTGQCEDSLTKRYVYNAQNHVARNIYYRIPNAATNTYGTASWRYWNSGFYGFDIVLGLPQALTVFMGAGSTNTSVDAAGGGSFGVALNTATQPPTESIYPDLGGRADNIGAVFNGYFPLSIGYHYLAAVQLGYTNPTYSSAQIFYGTSGGTFIAGMSTEVQA